MGIVSNSLQKSIVNNERTDFFSTRTPPAETAILKSNISKKKTKIIKAATKTIIYSKEDDFNKFNKSASISSGVYNKLINKLKFLFFQILLISFFISYGIFRFIEFKWNEIRLKLLSIAYNPSNTPQLIKQDVSKMKKIPEKLGAILELKSVGDIDGGLNGLMNDGSELVCWTVSAGVKHLILYDYDGILKKNVNKFRDEIFNKLSRYFGPNEIPKFCVRIPHLNKVFYNCDLMDNKVTNNNLLLTKENIKKEKSFKKVSIEITLLSKVDGRETIVDLTKTMSELLHQNSLKLDDITMDLVDKELTQLVGPEPDLILYFGPSLDIQGFPPWHIRLSEFYWEKDNNEVSYLVFIRGIKEYSNCRINLGK